MSAGAGTLGGERALGAQGVALGTALWVATLVMVVGDCTLFPITDDMLEPISVLTLDRIAFLVVAALFGAQLLRDPTLLRRFGRLEAAVGLYLALVLVSWTTTLAGKDGVAIKRDLHVLLRCFCMPYLTFLVVRHGGWSRRRLLASALAVTVAIAAFLVVTGVVQGLIDWRFLVPESGLAVHYGRSRGPFQHAIIFATLLGLLLPLAVTLRAHAAGRAWRVGLALLCLGLIEAVVLSKVRIVWLVLPLALLWLARRAPRVRRAALVAALLVPAAVGLAAAGVDLGRLSGPGGAMRQKAADVGGRMLEKGPLFNRVAVYATVLNMVRHRPLLGWGFGAHTFTEWRDPYFTSCCGVSWEWAKECAVPHNDALNLLMLLGVAGLVLYFGVLRELWRVLRSPAADPLARDLLACGEAALLLMLGVGLLHDTMYFAQAQLLFFFIIAAGAAAAAAPSEAAA